MSLKGYYKFKSFKNNDNLSVFIEYFQKKRNYLHLLLQKKRCLLADYFSTFKISSYDNKVILGIHRSSIFIYKRYESI